MTKVTSGARELIRRLREKEGKTLREICTYLADNYNLRISPSTVYYHLNPDYRERTKKRVDINRRRKRGDEI